MAFLLYTEYIHHDDTDGSISQAAAADIQHREGDAENMDQCETCAYFAYDEEYEEYYCGADMDEDDVYRMQAGHYRACPFYRDGDEYKVVRHQM